MERDRDFRIRAETIGDVMHLVIESLRLHGVYKTLPPISHSILWLMVELLDMEELDLHNRMVCSVSLGYLYDETGRAKKKKTAVPGSEQCEPTRKFTGHIRRAMDALIATGIVSLLERGNGTCCSKYQILLPRSSGNLRDRLQVSGRAVRAGGVPNCAPAVSPDKTITRAGGVPLSALARSEGHRRRAQRATSDGVKTDVRDTAGAHSENRTLDSSSTTEEEEQMRDSSTSSENQEEQKENAAQLLELLQNAGVNNRMCLELIALPTTTLCIVKAAILEASTKPEKFRPGLIVKCLRNPHGEISASNVDKARKHLLRANQPATQPTQGNQDLAKVAALGVDEITRRIMVFSGTDSQVWCNLWKLHLPKPNLDMLSPSQITAILSNTPINDARKTANAPK